MKFKDYYASLGLERGASEADIKKAYRKLAHKYHPDVSKEAGAEARFKEIAEAYQTLKDPEKRAAYDRLGKHAPGEEFRPPPDWGQQYAGREESFEGVDLADLFEELAARHAGGASQRAGGPIRGEDYELRTGISIEQAFNGALLELNLSMPEYDATGRMQRVPRTVKVRVPKGAADGQRLRLAGMGGRGFAGGAAGDLYLTIELLAHRLYRADGHDIFLELPLAPWEAALGATIEVPTPGGKVQLKVPAGTADGNKLRLSGRGLPRPKGSHGDFYAVARIVMPKVWSARASCCRNWRRRRRIFRPGPRGWGRAVMEPEVPELEWLDDMDECAAGELAQRSHLLEVEILELMHCGALPRHPGRALHAARMAARLRQDFELDLQGVALALTLLRRIDELQMELASLKAHFP